MLTSALGFEQVRTAGDTERTYGRTNGWEVGGSDPTGDLTASGSREVDSSVITGEQMNEVKLTVSSLGDDAIIRDQFPDDWDLQPFGQGTEIEDGVVEFRYSDGSEPVPASEVEGDDEVTFTYFVRAPSGAQNSEAANYGPAIADIDGEPVEFAGQDDVILIGVDI
jgi:hypothetical protein